MTLVKEIKANNRKVEVFQTKTGFSTLNYVNANMEILSHYNGSKEFKSLKGAERFATQFTSK
jgi:hypothetical protein